ncbi:MAG: CotH kinase family protein, partial [Kiritimatiellae bacterium]|nr:CotH kinase family protein [Kiritimatiellia bacterium]
MRRHAAVLAVVLCVVIASAAAVGAATVAKPTFSKARGFYDTTFSVQVSSATAGATIRYTTDGSKPTGSYGTILANGGSVSISRTTCLRAVGAKGGMTDSTSFTATYIFLNHVLTQTRPAGYPTKWGAGGWISSWDGRADYDMDPVIVNDTRYKSRIRNDLKAIPSLSVAIHRDDMFGVSGIIHKGGGGGGQNTIEREISAELICPDGRPGFQINCGMKSHTHVTFKRSFRLLFKNNYGSSTKLEYPIFERAPQNRSSAAGSFGKLTLRAGMNYNWAGWKDGDLLQTTYARDQWVRDTQIAMRGLGSHGTFMHLYINGLYWGVYNVVERPDARFMADYRGGGKGDWFAANHAGDITGNDDRWDSLHSFAQSRDLSAASDYSTLKNYLNTEAFADYILMNCYAGIEDWAGNNFYAFNRNNPVQPAEYLAWDGELTWNTRYGYPGAWIYKALLGTNDRYNDAPMCKLWRAITRNRDFITEFSDRIYKHCFNGGALTESNAKARWNAICNYVEPAIVGESARWGDAMKNLGHSFPRFTLDDHWRPARNRVTSYMTGNPADMVSVARASGYYPSIDPPTYSQHGGTVAAGFQLRISERAGAGTLYYRTDGQDPRVSGGGIRSGTASSDASTTIGLNNTVTVMTRSKTGATWSALAEAKFTVTGTIVPAPAAPTNLAASPASSTSVRLNWQDNSNNETGFKIDRRTNGSTTWVRVAAPAANATSFTDSGLAPATKYYYQVKAANAAGDSPYSNLADATTPADLQPPAAPSACAATPLSSSSVRVTWQDNSSDETGFKIDRR